MITNAQRAIFAVKDKFKVLTSVGKLMHLLVSYCLIVDRSINISLV